MITRLRTRKLSETIQSQARSMTMVCRVTTVRLPPAVNVVPQRRQEEDYHCLMRPVNTFLSLPSLSSLNLPSYFPIVISTKSLADATIPSVGVLISTFRSLERRSNHSSPDRAIARSIDIPTHRPIRHLSFNSSGEVRTALFQGREHLIVPIVALRGDIVVWPSNAPGKEFVPAEVLERSAREWIGRPVLPTHPTEDGEPVPANLPHVLESLSFGFIGNSTYQDNRLLLEAWLDPERANLVGGDAIDVINKVRSKIPISVSISGPVLLEEISGSTPDGEEYTGIWRDLGTDHLAMLQEIDAGACNNSEGKCGVILGKGYKVLEGKVLEGRVPEERNLNMKDKNRKDRMGFFRSLANSLFSRALVEDEGISTGELYGQLSQALRDIEPGDPIIEPDGIFPESQTFIYSVWIGGDILYYRRKYDLSEDGKVSISESRERVERETVWEVVKEEAEVVITTIELANSHESNHESSQSTHECQCQKGENKMGVKEIVDGLVRSGKVKETSRAGLEMLSEDDLNSLSAQLNTGSEMTSTNTGNKKDGGSENPNPTPEINPTQTPSNPNPSNPISTPTPPPSSPETPASQPVSLSAHLSQDDLYFLKEIRNNTAKHRDELIRSLVSTQRVYSEEQLKAKSLPELDEIAALISVRPSAASIPTQPYDYSSRGLSIVRSSETESVPPPPSIKDRIASRNKVN